MIKNVSIALAYYLLEHKLQFSSSLLQIICLWIGLQSSIHTIHVYPHNMITECTSSILQRLSYYFSNTLWIRSRAAELNNSMPNYEYWYHRTFIPREIVMCAKICKRFVKKISGHAHTLWISCRLYTLTCSSCILHSTNLWKYSLIKVWNFSRE